MSVQMVRFRADADSADQVRSQLDTVFAALRAAAPGGVTYTAYVSTATPEFLLVLDVEEGAENPLPRLPEAARLRELITRAAGSPVPPEPFSLVGAYTS